MGKGFAGRITRAHVVGILLVAALLLGGGGSPNREAELVLQCVFAGGIAAWFLVLDDGGRPPRATWYIATLMLGVPLLQLVPLPPSIWTALPGRAPAIEALAVVGAASSWRPLSIAPIRTVGALAALVPACALFLMTASLPPERLRPLLRIVGIAGLACVGIGAVQLAGGAKPYPDAHPGWLTGLFANRNAAADLLLVAALVWGVRATGPGAHRPLCYSACAVCVAGVLATGSRAGIALIPVVAAALAFRWRPVSPKRALVAAAVPVAGVLLLLVSPLASRLAPRFATFADARPDLWFDSWVAAKAFWPAGAGMGAFVPAFLLHERDSVIDASHPNRAHNDYLELLVEAGLLMPILLLVPAILLLRAWRAGWVSHARYRDVLVVAVGSLVIVALHSVVDYPLRNMALSCLTGFFSGCAFAIAGARRRRSGEVAAPRGWI